MGAPYRIQLPVYEGPLDLLLDLIRKQEMDIHNIPISKITGQYLDYLHQLEQWDVDVSADFIYVAATLILIKSKMLLPADPLAGPEEQADPRAELVNRLVEHEKFKSAAQLLYEKQQLEAHVWSKPDLSLYEDPETEGELVVSLVDLVRVFQQVLERRKQAVRIELRHDAVTVEQMMEALRVRLLASVDGVDLSEFFESCASRMAMICSLLAVLELVRLQAVLLTQGELFGTIRVRKHKMFDSVFSAPLRAGAVGDAPEDGAVSGSLAPIDRAQEDSPEPFPGDASDGSPEATESLDTVPADDATNTALGMPGGRGSVAPGAHAAPGAARAVQERPSDPEAFSGELSLAEAIEAKEKSAKQKVEPDS